LTAFQIHEFEHLLCCGKFDLVTHCCVLSKRIDLSTLHLNFNPKKLKYYKITKIKAKLLSDKKNARIFFTNSLAITLKLQQSKFY